MANREATTYEVKNHVAYLTLNRPEKKNAINYAMRKEVQDAYVDIKHNPDIWVAIITAAGDVFCSGKDIVEKMPENDGQVMSNDELYLYLRYLYKPIICAINGPCLAQGAGFALNSDILIFSERGSMGWPQVLRGISSVSGPAMCAHAIPWTKAMSYLMRGKFIPADECLRLGVATEVVPHEELLATAERYAQEILEAAPMAVCAIKEAARRGEDLGYQDRVYMSRDVADRILHTEDSKEGILAFREKRKPEWRGR